jgi:hypothetical protein
MSLSWGEVCRRAGGRRSYNLTRTCQRIVRQRQVVELWAASHGAYGWQVDAARTLGVSTRTIRRDMGSILRLARTAEQCPLCGQPYYPPLPPQTANADAHIPHDTRTHL